MNEDLLAKALERSRAAARASQEAAALPSLAEQPVAPGDVLFQPALVGLPVQWAVLPGLNAVVPVDAGSLVGSGDVALHEPDGVGRLTARCRFPQPLFPAALAAARRSGRLSAAGLARIERRCSELASGREGSFTEVETDHDPEYEDWLAEIVTPACRQWQELGSAPPLPFPQRSKPSARWLRWAAGIAAVLTLGALAGFVLQTGRISDLQEMVAQRDAALATREAEHAARERDLAGRLAASEETRRAAEEAAREQVATIGEDLRRARDAALVVNPRLESLEPMAAVRGEVKAIPLPARSSHLLLFLPVDQVVGGTLRLELREPGDPGRLLWQRDALERQKDHEVSVGVPAALLPSGELVLRLYRRERGREELIREHRLRVEREPAAEPRRRIRP